MFSPLSPRADHWRTEDSHTLSDARYWSHARYPSAKIAALAYLEHRTPGAIAIDYAVFGEASEDTGGCKLSPVEVALALHSVFVAASKRTHPHHWREWEDLRIKAPSGEFDDGALLEELTARYNNDHSYRDRIQRVDTTVEDYLKLARMWRPRRSSDDDDAKET